MNFEITQNYKLFKRKKNIVLCLTKYVRNVCCIYNSDHFK